jgi:hypothetical protein
MALGKGQLNHPTFETEARPELDLPVFGKVSCNVAALMLVFTSPIGYPSSWRSHGLRTWTE